jgi:aspartate kinase
MNLSELFSKLHPKPIYGVCTGKKSMTVFTSPENINKTIKELHALGTFKAVSQKSKVGMIEVTHPDFIDSPGWVSKISSALASKNVNIIEITTSKSTINVFIDEEKLNLASEIIGDVFEA